MSPSPATGAGVLLGVGREVRPGQGLGPNSYRWLRSALPQTIQADRALNPSPEVNPSGWPEPGMPGFVGIAPDLGVAVRGSDLLELLECLFKETGSKSNPETGAFVYVFHPKIDGVEPTLTLVQALPPTDNRQRFFDYKPAGLTLAFSGADPLVARFAGLAAHGTKLSRAVADGGNTGTYDGPEIRGTLLDKTLPVFVEVTNASPFSYKVEQIASSPTFPGAEVAVVYDADGNAIHQLLQNDDGSVLTDLGISGENFDPAEIVWPGNAAAHANADVGDQWHFLPQSQWSDPVPTYGAGNRFTASHLVAEYRLGTSGPFTRIPILSGSWAPLWPLAADTGPGSKYASGIDREGVAVSPISIVKKLRDTVFQDLYDSGTSFQFRLRTQGAQIGTSGQLRDGLEIFTRKALLATAPIPAANANAVQETLNLTCHPDDSGNPPIEVTVTTDRDFTIAT